MWDFIDFDRLSPMMQHYVSIKRQYPECLVLYRLGDFYEMFFEDAKEGARCLELSLTGRDCGLDERAPMCGVPHHVLDTYLKKIIDLGMKAVIVEQVEDPSQAKGLVKREVTRYITPGTVTDGESLQQDKNNYLFSLFSYGRGCGFSYADISTGRIYLGEIPGGQEDLVQDWIATIHPREVLWIRNGNGADWLEAACREQGIAFNQVLPTEDADDQNVLVIRRYLPSISLRKLRAHRRAQRALRALLDYIYRFHEERWSHLNEVIWVQPQQSMYLNATTRRNLELEENLSDRTKKYTLLSVMDKTYTAMGARLLSQWLRFPLQDRAVIEGRLDRVQILKDHLSLRLSLQECLKSVYDLERLLSKLSFERGNARDLRALANSLRPLQEMKAQVESYPPLSAHFTLLDPMPELVDEILCAIREDAPLSLMEGGIIQSGYSETLDALHQSSAKLQEELLAYEKEQIEETGIKKLRIVYRKNQGYFIEVTNSFLDRVPAHYERKQTLKNFERFTTRELQSIAGRIVGDEKTIAQEEYKIFQALRDKVLQQALRIQQTAELIAEIDVYLSFATIAEQYQYCRPQWHEDSTLSIIEGRHPVVEQVQEDPYIANDLRMEENTRLHLITGPNMAGKSTYMRQNALILIMAHMGSFVPASACSLPIIDACFTRIGASDHVAHGESTFMVEMKEMAEILQRSTDHSFLILDEIGRGTGTEDGYAIAQALLEHLAKRTKSRVLFATHFHSLGQLDKELPSMENYRMEVLERPEGIVFLHQVKEGRADQSYGIEVAKRVQLPAAVLRRAEEIFMQRAKERKMQMIQGSLFDSMHAEAQESFARPSSADSWSEDASWTEGEKKQALHPQLKEALQAILDMDIEQMRASEALFELDHLQQILQVCEGEIV